MYRHTAEDTLIERGDGLVARLERRADQSAERAAVLFGDDDVVRHIHQTAGEVTGVGGLHGRIGQTLTCTVRGDEVFEHRHTLLEVGEDGVFDDLIGLGTRFLRFRHQTTDTGELLDLVFRTTGSGVEHHEHGVEALVGLGHLLEQDIGDVVVDMRPCIDDLVVTLVVGDETHIVVVGDAAHLLVTFLNELGLLGRYDDIVEVERQSGQVSHAVTQVLDAIEELASLGEAHRFDDVGDDVAQRLLGYDLIDIAHLVGDDAIDDDTSDGCFH